MTSRTKSKLTYLVFVFILSTGPILSSCSESENRSEQAQGSRSAVDNWQNFVASVKNYSVAERGQLIAQAKQNLANFDKAIAELEKTMLELPTSQQEIHARQEKLLAQLKEKRSDLKTAIKHVHNSGVLDWKEVKNEFTAAYKDLALTISEIQRKFDDATQQMDSEHQDKIQH